MKAARVYANGIAQHSLNKKYCEEDFIAGAEWADAHPHWISVDDESPIDYEPVLAVVGGNHFAFVGICLNKKTWYCEIQNKAVEIIGITHWCHLPQPPVLSNSESAGKDLKGDEE